MPGTPDSPRRCGPVSAVGALAALLALAPTRVVAQAPHTIVLRADLLADARARVRAGDPALAPAYARLLREADAALEATPVAVTDKHTLLPPSGDPHDYFSLSPYWWPDPARADGLPYIRRDGETNPESKRDLDQPRVALMGERVRTLSLAYWLSGEERFAAGAACQLRTWFLDPATRMNPHLRFSQLVRGNPAERGSGIIDTRWFVEAVDAVALLRGSAAWTAADEEGMRAWAATYLRWLRESPNGKHEQQARNNHGSWYATQTAALALLVGDTGYVRTAAEGAKPRIGWQVRPDGSQPVELERTRSLHYSGFNAEALSRLAEIALKVGVDLWGYTAPEGGSLRAALDHLADYAGRAADWPGRQIDEEPVELQLLYLRRARAALPDDRKLVEAISRLPADVVRTDRSILLYPPPATGRSATR